MKRIGSGWFLGLALILIGLALFADGLGLGGLHTFIFHWWPAIFALLGISRLLNGRIYSGIFWLVIGITVSLFTANIIHYTGDIWTIIWSVAIILIGLRFIFRPMFHGSYMKFEKCTDNDIESAAIFGGSTKKISSKNFKHATANAVFGGAKIDLTTAEIAKEGAVIEVSAVFGGVEIWVPKKTPVKIDAVTIFGGHDDKRDVSAIDNSLPLITVKGEVVFGGIEIKN